MARTAMPIFFKCRNELNAPVSDVYIVDDGCRARMQVEDDCSLASVDDIAAAVHRIVEAIEQEEEEEQEQERERSK